MTYWLVKSEPDKYGWLHFTQQGRAVWDGVRNFQARNNLRLMQVGDQVLFYHSVTRPGVVGLATVVRAAYPDPTVPEASGWVAVDLEPVLPFVSPVTLARIKAEPMLAQMTLLKQSRLSVTPVRPDEFELILKMGQQP
ncbi:MAG: EVE domain-containing protein [Bacteroidetes bacterium]|nr:EVE domain-containing protein [Fibrella sp.]